MMETLLCGATLLLAQSEFCIDNSLPFASSLIAMLSRPSSSAAQSVSPFVGLRHACYQLASALQLLMIGRPAEVATLWSDSASFAELVQTVFGVDELLSPLSHSVHRFGWSHQFLPSPSITATPLQLSDAEFSTIFQVWR
jgi:hypothetical protein